MSDQPDMTGGEFTAEEQRLADLLSSRPPLPAPAFRGRLGRRVAALNPGYGHRPLHLWPTAAGFAAAGLIVMVIGSIAAGVL